MKGSIIAHSWRAYALSLALGLIAAANLAPAALAADSAKGSMAVPTDKYLDPKTGISLPESPFNHD